MTAGATSGPWQGELTRRALLTHALVVGSVARTLTGVGAQQTDTPPESGTPASQVSVVPEPKRGGTLRVGKPEDIILAGLPHLLTDGNLPLYNLVYDTLVTYDLQLNVQPRLATGWTWSADFRELTLQLRPGVTFHTGRPGLPLACKWPRSCRPT